eukprot:TRINITY_DN4607_c0_g2_i1.p1 TRINITY_DN4607_c0_g2~~TRINITY_DN4607_c0_g2_i1.p1  ORF type:complete len:841 (+),score=259.70 TRINITY_DN4607_c0_g2_i1:73-2595(+)
MAVSGEGLGELLAGFAAACTAVQEAARGGAGRTRREAVEAECLHAACALSDAVTARGLPQRAVAEADGGPRLGEVLRQLVAAPERGAEALAWARQQGGLEPPAGDGGVVLPGAAEVAERLATRPRQDVSPLEALPDALSNPGRWCRLLCDAALSAAGASSAAEAAAADLLKLLRLRGYSESAAAPLLRCGADPKSAQRAAAVLARLRGGAAEAMLVQVLRDTTVGGAGTALVRLWAQQEQGESGEGHGVTQAAARALRSGRLRQRSCRALRDALFDPPPPAGGARAAVRDALRRRALIGWGEGPRGAQPGALCHFAVLCIERTPQAELEGGPLLGPALDGVSARLASPITAHRRMAAVGATAVSNCISPDEPLDFGEFPGAYEEWVRECAEGGGGAQGTAHAPPTAPARRQPPPQPPQQDDPDELAFGGSPAAPAPGGGSAADWWGSDSEGEQELPAGLAANAPPPPGTDAEAAPPGVPLQDALKVLQGKKEDVAELERVVAGLEGRLRAERPEEVTAVATALTGALLRLSPSYAADDIGPRRRAALVAVCVRAPRVTAPVLINAVWRSGFSVVQRIDALRTLAAAAQELRHSPAPRDSGVGAEKPDASVPPAAAAAGILRVRQRREYPPQDDGAAAREAAAAEVQQRLDAKTRRWGSAKRPPAQPQLWRNGFDPVAPVFVYNLIGGCDGAAAEEVFGPRGDSALAAELLHTVWLLSELLGGCMSAEPCLHAVLDWLWEHRRLPPLLVAVAHGAAAAAVAALPEPPDCERLLRWGDEAAAQLSGACDAAHRRAVLSLLTQVQLRLDTAAHAADARGLLAGGPLSVAAPTPRIVIRGVAEG